MFKGRTMRTTLLLLTLLATIGTADSQGALMHSNRQRRAWGLEGRYDPNAPAPKKRGRPSNEDVAAREEAAKAAAQENVKLQKKLDRIRARCQNDPKYFYTKILAPQSYRDPITNRTFGESLGKIHDFMLDFLTFHIPGVMRYSALHKYMPEKDATGNYKERWLYWKTMDSKPVIQDGPSGPISKMFYKGERIWRGLLVRIKGKGLTKCGLLPRAHLKSTICNQTYILWRVIREPAIRTLIKSLNSPNARSFMDEIKGHFSDNDRFKRLYSHLGPPVKRKGAWNADFIKVYCDERIGKEPTVWAQGIKAETTSQHFDLILTDDVVGEKNTQTEEQRRKGCENVQKLQGVRDPSTELVNLGTRWEEDDSHGMFVNRDSTVAKNCSFMVATVEDDNFAPIWPEKWSPEAIVDKRNDIPIDRIYYGQYFNQFAGTSARNFKAEWIRKFSANPASIKFLSKRLMNIYMAFDTAYGSEIQKGKDYTACTVMGQSERNKRLYVLDGLNERLRAELIPIAVVDTVCRWRDRLEKAGYGGTLVVGMEETNFTSGQKVAIDYELRKRGVDDFHVVMLKHNKESKRERVRTLARPYASGDILWPERLEAIHTETGTPYDFLEMMRDQFIKYPGVTFDDIMDSKAMAFELTELPDYKAVRSKPKKPKPGVLPTRKESLAAANDKRVNLHGYDKSGEWGLV